MTNVNIHISTQFFPLGVFLFPYALMLFTCGIPLFFLEVSVGQLTRQGGITCWRKICPLFEGTPAINVRIHNICADHYFVNDNMFVLQA